MLGLFFPCEYGTPSSVRLLKCLGLRCQTSTSNCTRSSMVSTRLWRSTAYVPNHFAHVVRRFNLVFVPQLAIMNGSSILGRILPNLLAQKIGLYNTFVPISFCTGALIFALYGVKNAGGTVVIAVIYGFFSGACAYFFWMSTMQAILISLL